MTDAERITALESALEAVRAELAELRAHRATSLRQAAKCIACGHEQILHVREVLEETAAGQLAPLSLGASQSMWRGLRPGAPFEVFVCRACGLVEWYATNIGKLAVDGTKVIALGREPSSPTDPYR